MVEIVNGPATSDAAQRIRSYAERHRSRKLSLGTSTLARVLELSAAKIKVFHVCADWQGREIGVKNRVISAMQCANFTASW